MYISGSCGTIPFCYPAHAGGVLVLMTVTDTRENLTEAHLNGGGSKRKRLAQIIRKRSVLIGETARKRETVATLPGGAIFRPKTRWNRARLHRLCSPFR
jgi:hypothetical protein